MPFRPGARETRLFDGLFTMCKPVHLICLINIDNLLTEP